MKKTTWILGDKFTMLAYRSGRLTLVERTRKGLPRGAATYPTQGSAQTELDVLNALGYFPLCGLAVREVALPS